ncbi:hypothetical protein [Aequorivita flava]|uniref:Uncharacterized protein n=1 Tax=Aequorivita flava TaxID=3114371 RepID=A0AB35YUA9_9FLAO
MIYDRLFHHEFQMDFYDTEVHICIEHFKRYASFKCSNLNYIPRIGENIILNFLQAKVGTSYFYVEDVRHEFVEKKQIIFLMLKGGFYNSYWYYRKHKAIELREISVMDELNLYDLQIKAKLGRNY